MLVPSFLVTTLLALEGAEAIAYTNGGGGTKISWAQGRKVPKYGPGYEGLSFVRLALKVFIQMVETLWTSPCHKRETRSLRI